MAARLDSVCKVICERGGWGVTNLQLQKMLYMTQMGYMGLHSGARLADAEFEAWDYGPVEPNLYRKVRMFGSSPVQNVFFQARPFKPDDERLEFIVNATDRLLKLRPGDLVDITHWSKGAWAKSYVPGTKGIKIPDKDILEEYNARAQ